MASLIFSDMAREQAHMQFTIYFYVHLPHGPLALDPRSVIQLACVRDNKLTSLCLPLPARTCSENHLWPL